MLVYGGSTNVYSDVVSEGSCSLDDVREDSDEGGEEENGLLFNRDGVIVSALDRATKRP